MAREKHTGKDRGTKADAVYDYLTSNEFRQQVESIIEAHTGLIMQIQKEKVAFEKIWKEREAQAQRIIGSTARIYGSISGLAGQSLPMLPSLSLPEELDIIVQNPFTKEGFLEKTKICFAGLDLVSYNCNSRYYRDWTDRLV